MDFTLDFPSQPVKKLGHSLTSFLLGPLSILILVQLALCQEDGMDKRVFP